MKNYNYKEVSKMIDNKTLTVKILISCLGCIEATISKAAYMRKKFFNANKIFYLGWDAEMKQYMNYRKIINGDLNNHSQELKSKIMDMLRALDKDDVVTAELCNMICELVQSRDYSIID